MQPPLETLLLDVASIEDTSIIISFYFSMGIFNYSLKKIIGLFHSSSLFYFIMRRHKQYVMQGNCPALG